MTLVFATVLGALVGLGLVAARRGTLSARLPFGVFLAIGGLVALYAGDALVAFYLGAAG